MSKHAPWFPWYGKEYNADPLVMAMTPMQDLAYRRMIECSWELGAIPKDPTSIARLVRMDPDEFTREVWTYPLTECWEARDDGKLINHRTEDEREKAFARSVKASKAAKARSKKRAKRLKVNGRTTRSREKSSSYTRAENGHTPSDAPSLPGAGSENAQPRDLDLDRDRDQDPPLPTVEEEEPSPSPEDFFRYDPTQRSFVGNRLAIKAYVYEQFGDLGERWIQATFKSCVEWCIANEDDVQSRIEEGARNKTGHYDWHQFVQGWFRRQAHDRRSR